MSRRKKLSLFAALMGGGAVAIPWYQAGGIALTDIAGVWQPIGAASLAASYLRLAGSEGNANLDPAVVGGSAPAFNALTGWTGGSGAYLKTGIAPTATMSMVIRYSDAPQDWPQNIAGIMQTAPSSVNCAIKPNPSIGGGLRYVYWGDGTTAMGTRAASGVIAIIGDTNKAILYEDGVYTGDGTAATFGSTALDMYLLASNEDGVAASYFPGKIQAIAFYKTLTALKAIAVSVALGGL